MYSLTTLFHIIESQMRPLVILFLFAWIIDNRIAQQKLKKLKLVLKPYAGFHFFLAFCNQILEVQGGISLYVKLRTAPQVVIEVGSCS